MVVFDVSQSFFTFYFIHNTSTSIHYEFKKWTDHLLTWISYQCWEIAVQGIYSAAKSRFLNTSRSLHRFIVVYSGLEWFSHVLTTYIMFSDQKSLWKQLGMHWKYFKVTLCGAKQFYNPLLQFRNTLIHMVPKLKLQICLLPPIQQLIKCKIFL